MWVFQQMEKGSIAHTDFHNHLKSGHDLYLVADKRCYLDLFLYFKRALVKYLFTELKDPIAVIENNLKRIRLTLAGADEPTSPTTLDRFCNTLRFLLK